MSRRPKGKRPAKAAPQPRHRSVISQVGSGLRLANAITERWWPAIICVLLALAIWAVFGQTVRHEFVNYDDGVYVFENRVVAQGLGLKGIRWAFTERHGANWHPLTSVSHMMDCQLYGLSPGGHHLTSVLLHTANAILLFLVLRNMTGALWRSAFVAMVFAIHPLRVESVAWVAERKDVLSGLFFMLTVAAYAGYARRPFSTGRYCVVLVLLAMGLMSKPMLVTLPFVLLLLDYWPLGRLRFGGPSGSPPESLHGRQNQGSAALRRVVLEKIPMLLMVAASCVVTVLAQQHAIKSIQLVDSSARVGNALVACAVYMWQLAYPFCLAVLYPHPVNRLPMALVVLVGVMLSLISAGAIAGWRRHPYVIVGWLWYLGMLVPVIGLLQVGNQAHADRYTYLPQIGLGILVTWGAEAWLRSIRRHVVLLRFIAVAIVAGLLVAAHAQTSHWRNSIMLWSHTLACTSGNPEARNNLGRALMAGGRFNEAIQHFESALQIKPDYTDARINLGVALFSQGKRTEAIQQYEQGLALKPDSAEARYNLGIALAAQGMMDQAIQQFERALELKPDYADAHINLGNALGSRQRFIEASPHFSRALELKPDSPEAHLGFGAALAAQGRQDDAASHFQIALDMATAQGRQDFADYIRVQLRRLRSNSPQPQIRDD